jgi:AraC-like DNA-binding protein
MYLLYEEIYKREGITNFMSFFKDGLHLSTLSELGKMIVSTPDLLSLFQLGYKCNHRLASNEQTFFAVNGDKSCFKIRINEHLTLGHKLAIMISMTYIQDTFKIALGKDWIPLEIHYQFEKLLIEDPFIDFGKNIDVKYNQYSSGVIFKTSELNKNIEDNPGIISNPNIEIPQFTVYNFLSTKIGSLLDSFRHDKLPTINYFSEMANMSTRNFIRKLGDEDTSYFNILDNWRFKKAIQLLKNPGMKIKDLSSMLGYANSSNFERAFLRWTSVTPLKYKQSVLV